MYSITDRVSLRCLTWNRNHKFSTTCLVLDQQNANLIGSSHHNVPKHHNFQKILTPWFPTLAQIVSFCSIAICDMSCEAHWIIENYKPSCKYLSWVERKLFWFTKYICGIWRTSFPADYWYSNGHKLCTVTGRPVVVIYVWGRFHIHMTKWQYDNMTKHTYPCVKNNLTLDNKTHSNLWILVLGIIPIRYTSVSVFCRKQSSGTIATNRYRPTATDTTTTTTAAAENGTTTRL